MSGLSIGLSTFSSCNKAGSIPHFTRHLSRYPNDYQALTWRGRAYSIIGKPAEAKADFQRACRVSFGSQKLLAQALVEHIDGNIEQMAAILQNTTRQYPKCSEAWHELGSFIHRVGDKVDLSLQYLVKANELAKMNFETKDPWYPWCNQTIGDIYYKKHQVNEARKHYEAAVQSCNDLTIGHLGLSKCDILNNDLARAETSFLTAKSLNPVLVQWETFDDFRRQVQTRYTLASLVSKVFSDLLTETVHIETETEKQQRQIRGPDSSSRQDVAGERFRDTRVQIGGRSVSEPKPLDHYHDQQQFHENMASSYYLPAQYLADAKPRSQSHRSVSGSQGGRSGGSSGNGGSSDGSDADDEDEPKAERKWKKIIKNAPSAKKYRGKTFYQSENKEYWYTKVKTFERHGHQKKSYLKRYKDRGRTIELDKSIDEDFEKMSRKHESGKYDVIKKSDMVGIF